MVGSLEQRLRFPGELDRQGSCKKRLEVGSREPLAHVLEHSERLAGPVPGGCCFSLQFQSLARDLEGLELHVPQVDWGGKVLGQLRLPCRIAPPAGGQMDSRQGQAGGGGQREEPDVRRGAGDLFQIAGRLGGFRLTQTRQQYEALVVRGAGLRDRLFRDGEGPGALPSFQKERRLGAERLRQERCILHLAGEA